MPGYVHLRAHSCFSFLDGLMQPLDMVKAAAEMDMTHVALTDSANLCGAVDLSKACEKVAKDLKKKVRPIYGAEIWILPDTQSIPEPTSLFPSLFQDTAAEIIYQNKGYQVAFLVKSAVGYKNLCELLTLAHKTYHYAPRLSPALAFSRLEGLFVLIGGTYGPAGMLPEEEALHTIRLWKEAIVPGDLLIDLHDHGLKRDAKNNEVNRRIAHHLELPLLATNACQYRTREQSSSLELMHCIAKSQSLFGINSSENPFSTDQAYYKSPSEMTLLFESELIERTQEIADRCLFDLERNVTYLPITLPPETLPTLGQKWEWLKSWIPTPNNFGERRKEPPPEFPEDWPLDAAYFAWYARKGLEVRLQEFPEAIKYGNPQEYAERLEMEIQTIVRMKFPTYLLIVAEFVNWARDHGVSVGPGRGSAAGSLVAWTMRITDVNPLQFGLMFERFLNPARISMPDIDMDFSQADREKVIEHVREKYGTDKVGQILTIGTMGAKQALRDTARSLNVHFEEQNQWSHYFEDVDSIEEGMKQEEPLLLYQSSPSFRTVIDLAKTVEGLPRQPGVHAAGIVISSRTLASVAPVHTDPSDGRTLMGCDMKAAETLGAVKFDFLGLKTLDILKEAIHNVKETTGKDIDLLSISLDDPKVFELLSRGDGLGLFQVESHGLRLLMKRLKPEHIEDVIALLALYRPGPLKSGMVDQFVECKHGRAEIAYPHPMLEPVLSMTYGVIVYQEQVMNAARVLAGYSLAEADLLRRAMGKKIAAEMQKQKSRFVEGAISNEVRKEIAESIFDLIDHFSGYGFNKAHSTSYGIITYQTAWLKTYHRAELMAAVMSWEQAKREQLTQYVYDCIQADIPVLPPDINESTDRFTVICLPEDKKAIRYGLSAIKGFGEAAYKDLWAERQQRGPFQDLEDFLRRKPKKVTKASVLALLHAGALDSFGISRKELFHRIEAQKDKKKITRNPLQPELISTESKPDSPHEEEEKTPLEWTTTAQLEREAERLGFWVTGHPLDRYHDVEVRFRTATTLEVESLIRGTPVNLVGILTKIHRIQTRHGDLMTFLTIADRIGMTEVVLFPEVYERHKKKIQVGAPLLVSGVPEASEGQGKIQVQDLTDLPTLRAQIATTLHLYLTREETERSFLSSLLDLFAEYRGTCPVQIAVQETGQESPLGWCEDLGYKVVPTQELFDEIERRTGRPDALRIPSTPHKRR